MAAFNVNLKIRETYFKGNSAPDGGGALVVNSESKCHVVRSEFQGNTASTLGGAVGLGATSSLQIENTNFTNNNSTDGGAIYVDSMSKLQTTMCSYWKNFAKGNGGAIYMTGYSTAKIESCHFLSNQADYGGAVNLHQMDQVSVRDTFFLRNMASNRGGALAITDGTNANIINYITCIGNRSPRGGCLLIQSVILTVNNSDISENFGRQFAAGFVADFSRVQVSFGPFNRNRSTFFI